MRARVYASVSECVAVRACAHWFGLLASDLPQDLAHGVRRYRLPLVRRFVGVDCFAFAHVIGVKRYAEPAEFAFRAIELGLDFLRKIADLDHALKALVVEHGPQLGGIAG